MTLPRKKPFGNATESRNRQISRAAGRLDLHKKSAKVLALSLRSRIQSGYASPGNLWIAGGTGFLLAEWIHRPMGGPHLDSGQPSKSPRRSQTAAMTNAGLLLEFALDMRTLWQRQAPGATAPAEASETPAAG